MPSRFKILDYVRSVMIQDLSSDDVCAILKSLMINSKVSFDVVVPSMRGLEFRTADFQEMDNKSWRYNPQPQAEESR